MAIKRFKRDNFGNGIHSEFFIDSADDLEVIEDMYDCELGDRAFTPTGAEYVRHSDEFEGDLWEEVSGDNSSGSDGGMLVVQTTFDESTGTITLAETWQSIFDNMSGGKLVVVLDTGDAAYMSMACIAENNGSDYNVVILHGNAEGAFTTVYTCESANDYPSFAT